MSLTPNNDESASRADASEYIAARSGDSMIMIILKSLGSLRLTVALLAIGLFVVWVATMQQTRADISRVKHEHFHNVVVSVPFQVLIPPAWLPNWQNVEGGFIMPSGVTVIVLLLVNLLSAHLFRFRVQARGNKLAAGIVLSIIGLATTIAVIGLGNTRGFQDVPWISWHMLWYMLLGGVAGLVVASVVGVFSMGSERRIERILLSTLAIGLGGVLAYCLMFKFYIGDDAMRVVWRLMQGMAAAIVFYIGCVYLFRRKAGVVLIHAGILMLMLGEIYTTYSAHEQRMTLGEGQSSEFAVNIERAEFALIQANEDGSERVVTVPARMLKKEGTLDIPELPFKIRTIKFFDNSSLQQVSAEAPNSANRGIGRFVVAFPAAVSTGTDQDQAADFASAYVQLLSKDGDADLGTYLVSQILYRNTSFDLDTVNIDGKDYQIGLRFKHYYKPYTIHLIDTNRTNYVGTQIAQTYSSEFRLADHRNNVEAVKKISMNNPLRYNNETFYQSGHHVESDGSEFSVLQIVQNTGWMIPYVSCAFVGFGLLVHFLAIFSGYLEKLNRHIAERPDISVRWSWAIIIGLEIFFGLFVLRQMMPKTVEYEGMRLERLGEVPVVYGGRVQPLDSLARTTLRKLRKRETAVDGKNEDRLAIRWIADVMFGADEFRDYRVFKVDDPEVASLLRLQRRKYHLYSLDELEKESAELRRITGEAKALEQEDPSALTAFQRNAVKLSDRIDLVYMIRFAYGNPEVDKVSGPLESIAKLNLISRAKNVAMTVPYEGTDEGWVPMSRYLAWQWFHKIAKDNNLTTTTELADHIVEAEFAEELRQETVKREIFDSFVRAASLDQLGLSREELEQRVEQILANPPPQIKETLDRTIAAIQPRVDAQVQQQLEMISRELLSQLTTILGDDAEAILAQEALPQYLDLGDLQQAYLSKDAETFNAAVDKYLNAVKTDEAAEFNNAKIDLEVFHNYFSPFVCATVLYIISLVFALLSLCGMCLYGVSGFHQFSVIMRRSAFWLVILSLLVHTIGLLVRMYISGRPPVTNLYSSAVFIGWFGVLLGLGIEIATRLNLGTVIASAGGLLTLLVAYSLSLDDDTFSVLVAVLDTQFWLATHVVCITLGYGATFAAGALGAAYIIGTMCTPFMDKPMRRTITQLCYGVTCFALLLSFVGTVLGGLWADDSWGRFWGWDSKENGALMIVLVTAILLHARWGGLIREKGIALIAILGSAVTIWSWFAVNELGVGLHSYGFSEGRMIYVMAAWIVHGFFLAAMFIPYNMWWSIRAEKNIEEKVA